MSLELRNLVKVFRQGDSQIQVLKGLQAHVADGEVVAILGESGSGKSTLLSILAGLDRPTSGEVAINGQVVTAKSEIEMTKYRAKNIGIVFQQFHLMSHLTALENVSLPLEILGVAQADERAKEALTEVGLAHRFEHLPSQLSGGECQRVAVARALVTRPQLLLADEPSGNLDVETGRKVMKQFFEVVRRNHITTLVVTHSAEVAAHCDRQLTLKNGVL